MNLNEYIAIVSKLKHSGIINDDMLFENGIELVKNEIQDKTNKGE